MKKITLLSTILGLIFLTNTLFAQFQNHLWQFGTSGGIMFDKVTNAPTVYGTGGTRPTYGGSTPEGNAVALNPKTGALLFCTDGVTVYNSTGTQMAGGANIGGNNDRNTMQAVAIAPVPDCSYTKFYIFINTANTHGTITPGDLTYRIVDMNLNGGLGGVLPATAANTLRTAFLEESMGVILNPDNGVYWLVYKGINDAKFYSTRITANPADFMANTTEYVLPLPGGIAKANTHAFNYNYFNGKIAFGGWSPTQHVYTVDWDRATGAFSNFVIIDNMAQNEVLNATTSIVYDCEWSPDGTKLYTNQLGATNVVQYDFSQSPRIKTKVFGDPANVEAGCLKTGPDGKIYFRFAIPGVTVHAINNPNAAGALCNFRTNVLTLNAGANNAYEFPEITEYIDTTIAIQASAMATCQGDSIQLTVLGGISWVWNTGQTGNSIFAKTSGTYFATGTFVDGCTHRSNGIALNFTIPAKANAGADASVACGSTTNLMATAPATGSYSYQWIGGPATQAYNGVGAGTYILRMTDNATSCSSLDTVVISNTGQSFTISGVPATLNICKGDAASVTANISPNGTYTYTWRNTANNIVSNTATLNVPNATAETYSLTVSDGSCTDQRTVSITITDAKGPLTYTTPAMLCTGDSVRLTAPVSDSYAWNTGQNSRTIFAKNTGAYYCTLSVGTCQANTDTATFTFNSVSGTISASQNMITTGSSVDFNISNTNGVTFSWDFADGSPTDISQNPTHTYTASGAYAINCTITNAAGCPTTLSIGLIVVDSNAVTPNSGTLVKFPTVFTPNADGTNDEYIPFVRNTNEFLMGIFDRWGALVFATNADLFRWKGLNTDGSECYPGVYSIIAQTTDPNGVKTLHSGTVLLVR